MSPAEQSLVFAMPWYLTSLSVELVWSAALLVALACALLSARRSGLDPRDVYWASVLGLLFGVWGGHLLGIVYYGTDGRPWAWIRFWSGGQAQYGGLITGALATALFLKARRLRFLSFADAMAPAVALGIAVGRIGCFLNGDDFGTVSHLPWAVRFPAGTEAYADQFVRGWVTSADQWSLPVHPVQLYCTVFWLALAFALARWWPAQRGLRFGAFLIAHGSGRMLEQLFRGDFRPALGPLSLTQVISVGLIFVGACIWLRQRGTVKAEGKESRVLLPST
ncbi:MAG: prolipoprotein diacylglyceryl transferase [Acidobacteriia bacterium]|nr:prolipoprotein diacylglyceryl transferase [Terriglobia bacterium]